MFASRAVIRLFVVSLLVILVAPSIVRADTILFLPTVTNASDGTQLVSLTAISTDTSALRSAVTVEGVREHLQALQEIANANGGTRVSGLAGHNDSAAYVAAKLTAVGYQVTIQSFE